MLPSETWLLQHGPSIAVALNSRRELICGAVSTQLAETFPSLCYDPSRIDAVAFQQHTFHETPRRFHRTLQTSLYFASLTLIEREYEWTWTILRRYGVAHEHMLAMVHWYFEAVHTCVSLNADAHAYLALVEAAILQMVHRVAAVRVRSVPRLQAFDDHP